MHELIAVPSTIPVKTRTVGQSLAGPQACKVRPWNGAYANDVQAKQTPCDVLRSITFRILRSQTSQSQVTGRLAKDGVSR